MATASRIPSILVGCAGLTMAPAAIAATCDIPNTITNVQVANATKVMGNFNAVANCAQLGVTVTGAPTSGAIAAFSSPTTITSSDLSGDLTTSGGSATTLAGTGVLATSYVNPTITIDPKGRITNAASNTSTVPAPVEPTPWQQVTVSSTPVAVFGDTFFASASSLAVTAGKQIEVELYATKSVSESLFLALSANGTSAYGLVAQSDGNLVNYRYNGSVTAMSSSGASSQNWSGLFRCRFLVVANSMSQSAIWSVVNDQRVNGTGASMDSNVSLVGNVTIYVKSASFNNILYLRARVVG